MREAVGAGAVFAQSRPRGLQLQRRERTTPMLLRELKLEAVTTESSGVLPVGYRPPPGSRAIVVPRDYYYRSRHPFMSTVKKAVEELEPGTDLVINKEHVPGSNDPAKVARLKTYVQASLNAERKLGNLPPVYVQEDEKRVVVTVLPEEHALETAIAGFKSSDLVSGIDPSLQQAHAKKVHRERLLEHIEELLKLGDSLFIRFDHGGLLPGSNDYKKFNEYCAVIWKIVADLRKSAAWSFLKASKMQTGDTGIVITNTAPPGSVRKERGSAVTARAIDGLSV